MYLDSQAGVWALISEHQGLHLVPSHCLQSLGSLPFYSRHVTIDVHSGCQSKWLGSSGTYTSLGVGSHYDIHVCLTPRLPITRLQSISSLGLSIAHLWPMPGADPQPQTPCPFFHPAIHPSFGLIFLKPLDPAFPITMTN